MSSQPQLSEAGGQASPSSMLQQVQEIRSHYSFEVRDRTLLLGYDMNGAARRYSLPFANMPLSRASAWLLYGGPMRTAVTSTFVIDTIRGAENMAHRSLTQTEAEGYAHHASRRTMYSFASSVSAVWIGSIFAVYGRKSMKFPFRKPQPLERYNNFPNRWLPLLSGNYARMAWQITRFNVYTILSLALIAPIYSSMGDSAMMVGLYRDQRTHEVTKGMAAALRSTNGRLERHASNRSGAAQTPHQPSETGDEDGFYISSEQGAANTYGNRKEYNGDTTYTDGTAGTSILDGSQTQGREARQSSPSSFSEDPIFRQKPIRQPSPEPNNKPVTQSDRDSENSFDPDFIFDDASPTNRNDHGMNAGDGFNGVGSGSAWERVRSGQTGKSNESRAVSPLSWRSSQGAERGQCAPNGMRDKYEASADSFSFSSDERDRQLAKEQAQKDFDKILDEERKGVEGVGASGAGGAWSRRRGG